MQDSILMHITYYEKNYPLETAFKKAAEFDYDGIELRIPKETPETQIAELVRLRDKYGIGEITFGGGVFVLTGDDQPNVAQELERWRRAMEVVSERLDCCLVNVSLGSPLVAKGARYIDFGNNGSAMATDVHYRRAAEALHILAEIAAQNEMTMVVEMHGCSIADTAKSTMKLLKMVDHPNLKVNFDYGNLYHIPHVEPLNEALTLLQGRIGYVHVKNACRFTFLRLLLRRWHLPLLEDGEIDYNLVVAGLRQVGYVGYWTCEAPGLRGNPDVHAKRDIAYLQRLLAQNPPAMCKR